MTATVEQPPVDSLVDDTAFAEQLAKMDKPALVAYLKQKFNHDAAEDVTKADLAKAIVALTNATLEAAAQQNAESTEVACAAENDRPVRIRFQNLETPGVDLEFCYGNAPVKRDRNGKLRPAKIPRYHLIDGQEATVPYSVYDHLNNLTVPDYQADVTPEGFVRSVTKGKRKRFSCELVLTEDQKKSIGIGS